MNGAMKRILLAGLCASFLGSALSAFGNQNRGVKLPQCIPGQAPTGVQVPFSKSYQYMVERTCHWNCYMAGVDFFPPAPPEYWSNGTYTAAECADWCDALPGCTGFEFPTGCSGAACEAYPDKSIPGSYCGLFFRGMCQSSSSPGFHVSPGFDTYIRSAPAMPRNPYYAYSEQLQPTPEPRSLLQTKIPPKIASLLSQGNGFAHLEKQLNMQLAMDYPMFFNKSALLPDFPSYWARVDEKVRQNAWQTVSNLTHLFGKPIKNAPAGWTVAAALLLMLELYDPVHEIVLGNQPLLPSSQVWDWVHTFQDYPGSYWLYRPMSPENHYLHAILHRIEGNRIGEANLTGYNNSKFWYGGGVEQPSWGLGSHPVFASLAAAASSYEPLRKCCISTKDHIVTVPPGRQVKVAAGWNPFAFVDFHRAVVEGRHPRLEDIVALRWAQRFEFELLFNYSLNLAMDSRSDPFLSGKHTEVPVILRGKNYKLWAQRWGVGPVKILLVHGGPGCSHVAFDSLTDLLSPLNFELIFFDQLGGGNSDCADPSSVCYSTQPAALDDFVEQIEQVRRYMNLPPKSTVLFGHSWGVMLTIEHALKYPGAVTGYVLAGFPASLAAQMNRMHVLAEMQAGDFFGNFICRTKPCPQSFVWGASHCNSELTRYLLWTNDGFSCTGVLCSWNRWRDLGKIAAPSLLMVGEFDIAQPADVRKMAEMMPHATFVEFPNSGHAEWIDASSAFQHSLSVWVSQTFGRNLGSNKTELNLFQWPRQWPVAPSYVTWLCLASLLAGASTACFGMHALLMERLQRRAALINKMYLLMPPSRDDV